MLPEDVERNPRYSVFIILGVDTFYTFSLLIDKLGNETYAWLLSRESGIEQQSRAE